MVCVAHWLACIWYIMFLYAKPSGMDWSFLNFEDDRTITMYLGTFYYCFLTLVGNNQVGGWVGSGGR